MPATLVKPRTDKLSAMNVNTGVFEESSARRIREPVTVIFSTDTDA